MHASELHIGQWFGNPSGVRDEIVISRFDRLAGVFPARNDQANRAAASNLDFRFRVQPPLRLSDLLCPFDIFERLYLCRSPQVCAGVLPPLHKSRMVTIGL